MGIIKWINKIFALEEGFFYVTKSSLVYIRMYYSQLFVEFVSEVFNKQFFINLIYDKSYDLFSNVLSIFLLFPVYKVLWLVIKYVIKFFFGIYFFFINYLFDLIIKYVDIFSKRLRVFYFRQTILEINEMRRILLFVNVKENFLIAVRPPKDKVIDNLVYKERFIDRHIRIFLAVILFFLSPLPLFFSYISYIVRVLASIVWTLCKIVFYFFFTRILRYMLNFRNFFKILRRKYRMSRLLWKKRKRSLFKIGPNSFFRVGVKFVRSLFIVFEKLYYNVSVLYKQRYFVVFMKNLFIKSKRKSFFNSLKLSFDYSSIDLLFVNIFEHLKHFVDIKIIKGLQFYANFIKDVNVCDNKFSLYKYGSLLHKLNLRTAYFEVYFFLARHVKYYDLKKKKIWFGPYYKRLFIKVRRILILVRWEIIFPLYIFLWWWIFWFLFCFYFVFILFKFIFVLLYEILKIILRFFVFIFISVFSGRG